MMTKPKKRTKPPVKWFNVAAANLQRNGVSYHHLAHESGLSVCAVQRIFTGQAADMTVSTLIRLCRAMGCHPNDLMDL